MANARVPKRSGLGYASPTWWQLLYTYLRDSDTLRANPLLGRSVRREPRLPKWRPQISSLWFFPIVAVGLLLPVAADMDRRGGIPAVVLVGFTAGLYVYPPYLLSSGIGILLPARVAPVLSAEIQARTLDILRLTNLSTAEIVLGKLLGALSPFAGLFKYLANFLILLIVLGSLGASAVPGVLGVPPSDTLAAIALLVLPGILGPIVNIFFISALSVAVSAHTLRPSTSIGLTYGVVLVYWVLTGLLLVAILLPLSTMSIPGSLLMRSYTASPMAFVYPNVLRLALSIILTPVLIQVAIRRIEQL